MRSNKKHFSLGLAVALSLGLAGSTVYASNIGDSYATGDTLTAAKMDNIKNAVNDNNTRITNLQTGTGSCAGNPAVSGDSMVRAGSVCIDKYEASISGGVARSLPNVLPAVNVTWFDAANACARAGKRLPTNAEWQTAAVNTPAGGAGCNGSGTIANTGANPTCVSTFGAQDMAGNVSEWVADVGFTRETTDPAFDTFGIIRGGTFADGAAATINWLGFGDGAAAGGTDDLLVENSFNDTRLGASAASRGFRCAR